jgi:Reverse transcriptase (RNA-dependent DNA polymerase)
VNYDMDSKSYRIWDQKEHKVITTRDVNFLKDRYKGEKGESDFFDKNKTDEVACVTIPMGFMTARQIKKLENSKEWEKAMRKEYVLLVKHRVWDIIQRTEEKVLKTRWVLWRKEGNQCAPYKERFVVKGCAQVTGIDATTTYFPTLSKDLLRMVLAICTKYGLHMKQMDVQSAFLHEEIDKQVLIELPEIISGEEYRKKYLGCLRKALYGLSQAPLLWCEKLSQVLLDMGYTQCDIDACVYAKKAGSRMEIRAVYRDNSLICGESQESIDQIADKLAESFMITDIVFQDEMIGWNISRVNNSIVVTQEKYIRRLQEKY